MSLQAPDFAKLIAGLGGLHVLRLYREQHGADAWMHADEADGITFWAKELLDEVVDGEPVAQYRSGKLQISVTRLLQFYYGQMEQTHHQETHVRQAACAPAR